jgi:hypothetical protein
MFAIAKLLAVARGSDQSRDREEAVLARIFYQTITVCAAASQHLAGGNRTQDYIGGLCCPGKCTSVTP